MTAESRCSLRTPSTAWPVTRRHDPRCSGCTCSRAAAGEGLGGDVLRSRAGAGGAAGARARRRVGALRRLLPGAVTVLLPNPERLFPLACGEDPETLGCASSRSRSWPGVAVAGAAVEREPRRRARGALAGRGRAAVGPRGRRPRRRRRRAARGGVDRRRPAPVRGRRIDGCGAARRRRVGRGDRRRAGGPVPLQPRHLPRADPRGSAGLRRLPGRPWSRRAGPAPRRSSSSGRGRGRPRGGCWRGIPPRRSSGSTRAARCLRSHARAWLLRATADACLAADRAPPGPAARGAVRRWSLQRAVRPPPDRGGESGSVLARAPRARRRAGGSCWAT